MLLVNVKNKKDCFFMHLCWYWFCDLAPQLLPLVKADNIALAPVILNAVGEEAASASHRSWLNMQNLNQTPPQTYWIRVCILTRSQGVYLHSVKHEKYCSRLLIFLSSETLWRSLTPKKNFPFGIEYMIFSILSDFLFALSEGMGLYWQLSPSWGY